MQSGDAPVYSYTSRMDLAADNRWMDRYKWDSIKPWTRTFTKASFDYSSLILVGYFVGINLSADSRIAGFLVLAALGPVLHFVVTLLQYDERKRARVKEYGSKTWECHLSPTSYTTVTSDGVSSSVPWELIEIYDEDSDVWLIRYSGTEAMIYRESLRAAGLEEEFRSRIGKKPLNGDQ